MALHAAFGLGRVVLVVHAGLLLLVLLVQYLIVQFREALLLLRVDDLVVPIGLARLLGDHLVDLAVLRHSRVLDVLFKRKRAIWHEFVFPVWIDGPTVRRPRYLIPRLHRRWQAAI